MVGQLSRQVQIAEKSRIEIGGILLGTEPTAETPTLRIDDFELVARRVEDGPMFVLDPKKLDRLIAARWNRMPGAGAGIGFFRTHLRPGALRPSLADRAFFTGELKDHIYALLLVEGSELNSAALFVGSRGELPDEPSVREFRLSEAEFSALPEVTNPRPLPTPEAVRSSRTWWYVGVGGILALVLIVGLFLKGGAAGAPANGINLAVSGDHILEVTWNHASPDLAKATSARLVITDGPNRREIALGPDELMLGDLEYQRATAEVQVTLTVEAPSRAPVVETATWR